MLNNQVIGYKEFPKNCFSKKLNNKILKLFVNKSVFSKIPASALEQLESITQIKEVESPIIAHSDICPGFSVPIGTSFLSLKQSGIISPSAVGYDINCGVRLIKTNLTKSDLTKEKLIELRNKLNALPIGLSKAGYKITKTDLDEILNIGINWCIKKKICSSLQKTKIESKGVCKFASSNCVSVLAKKRGLVELGTLGQGNHFIDVLFVDKLFNQSFSKKFGLKKNQVVILIHTGSRGLGHQVATDYNQLCEKKIPFPYLEFNSILGQKYFKAMNAASNFAFVNREILSLRIKTVFSDIFVGQLNLKLDLVCDLSHNIASLETINKQEYIVHRKGSTLVTKSAPIILPGSMLDNSFLLFPDKFISKTFNTLPHGLGRSKSRLDAKEEIKINALHSLMTNNGILLGGRSENVMREEQPGAYKDSSEIISTLTQLKLAKVIVSFKPLIVITG